MIAAARLLPKAPPSGWRRWKGPLPGGSWGRWWRKADAQRFRRRSPGSRFRFQDPENDVIAGSATVTVVGERTR